MIVKDRVLSSPNINADTVHIEQSDLGNEHLMEDESEMSFHENSSSFDLDYEQFMEAESKDSFPDN